MNDKADIMRFSRRCYYVCLIVCGILGIGYLILLIADISLFELNPYPCSLYSWSGLYCPGCGGTRAMNHLLHGRFIKSFICHPVVPYVACLVTCFMVSHTLYSLTKGKVKAMLFRPIYCYIMIVIIFVQCAVKNCMEIFGQGYPFA